MIGYLRGIIRNKRPDSVVLDVNGVGYTLSIPLSTFYRLASPDEEQEFHIHTHVREDQISLFGFLTTKEMDIFRALCAVHGIGPRSALTILSGMESDTLLKCITEGDTAGLSGIPGIGRKTAERIILELKERLNKYITSVHLPEPSAGQPISASSYQEDLLSALMNLGYSRPQAEKGVRQALQQFGDDSFETLLKQTLKLMMTR